MRYIRVIYRFLFFALYTTRIVAEVYTRRILLRQPLRRVMRVRRRWARRVLYGTGVRVQSSGRPPDFPCLLVANHRSYLDPIILLREVYAFPVSKAELSKWPVIGKGARWAGILYVQREQGGSRVSALRAIADVILQQGFPVLLFPEGTTSELPGMLPFKKGAFRTALKWDLPVVPVAIRFENPDDYWVGDISFSGHAWQRFQHPRVRVRVVYGPVLRPGETEDLEAGVRSWIESQLIPGSKPQPTANSR